MPDKPSNSEKQDMSEVKRFNRGSLKKTEVLVKNLLPTQEVIEQEKKEATKATS